MHLLEKKTTRAELQEMAKGLFGNLVKAVVDVEQRLIVVDAEMHSDQESFLLNQGSRQQDLWGINFYPELPAEDGNFVEFDSMINLRPMDGNMTRSVENPETQARILEIVRDWVQ